jgi:hypothetical protein
VWDRKHVGPATVLTHDVVNTVEETLTLSPCRSLRRLSRKIGLSETSCYQAIRQLKLTVLSIPISA